MVGIQNDRQSQPAGSTTSGLAQESLTILLMGLAVILVIMNTAMYNLALTDLTAYFQLPSSTVSLTITGYSIMFAISSITYSRLADFVPISRLYTISLATVGIASLIGLFSQVFWLLLFARVAQAAGAGAVISLSIVLMSRYVPVSRRGRAMAIVMSAVSLGLGLGPVVGGFVVQYLGWRYLFAIPSMILIVMPMLIRLLPKEKPAKGRFDVVGAVLAGLGTTGALLYLTSHQVYALLVAIGCTALFIWRIYRVPEPFVLPALFTNRRYVTVAIIGITSYICSFATLFLLPQMLLNHFHLEASVAGFVIFPGAMLAVVISRRVGRSIDQRGNERILKYAPLLQLLSIVCFALVGVQFWPSDILVYMIMSLAFTMISSSAANEISRLLPAEQVGSGNGLFQLLQFFSGAFSVAFISGQLSGHMQSGAGSGSGSGSQIYFGIFVGLALLSFIPIVLASRYRKSWLRPSNADMAVVKTR